MSTNLVRLSQTCSPLAFFTFTCRNIYLCNRDSYLINIIIKKKKEEEDRQECSLTLFQAAFLVVICYASEVCVKLYLFSSLKVIFQNTFGVDPRCELMRGKKMNFLIWSFMGDPLCSHLPALNSSSLRQSNQMLSRTLSYFQFNPTQKN